MNPPHPDTPGLHPDAKELTWRVLVDPPLPGARNMARDHALASCSAPSRATLRLYRWTRPTVSFGRNEPARDRYHPDRAPELDFVRRPTGGRAVLHHRELTYAVTVPLGALGGLRDSYRIINLALIRALGRLTGKVRMAGPGTESLGPDQGPCFRAPAEGEVTADGRKLVGSAQVRIGGAILQHGSILLEDDQELLDTLRGGAEGDSPGGDAPATLGALLAETPRWQDVAEAICRVLPPFLGGRWDEGTLTAEEAEIEADLLDRYGSQEWTWRR